MNNQTSPRTLLAAIVAGSALAASSTGCMVGPDYKPPPAPVAEEYRDTGSDAVRRDQTDLAEWWRVLNDPTLDGLVLTAYRQNPTLRSAAVRVLEAQARRGIAVGLLFPQDQAAFGGYTRNMASRNQGNSLANGDRYFDNWQLGAAASWELDFWGRFRRGIESADAEVLSAVASYDDALVSLIGDVATEYVSIRILQERLAVTRHNVDVQRRGLEIAETRFRGGTATDLDRAQATTLLRDTEALIPELEAGIVQGQNRLCVLLGIPPRDLNDMLGGGGGPTAAPATAPATVPATGGGGAVGDGGGGGGAVDPRLIPMAPASVAVGIPADLLRRRPDIRRAERDLAAQSARIGIAKADLYPSFSLVGDVRLSSEQFGDLFEGRSVQAFGGPTFRWAILNYGRIENAVRVEDARFQALIGAYESTVLRAQADVENAIAGYLGAQRQVALLGESVAAAARAVQVAEDQYRGGTADYTRVLLTQDFLQTEQDRLVSVRGAVVLNLVSLYRALGGGWDLREHESPVDERTRDQMKSRTNWGKFLDPEPAPADPAANGAD